MLRLPTYVIITPARNEAAFIELVLASVTAQSVLPLRWVIVSDGSTDATDEIVTRWAKDFPWIELLRLESGPDRSFSSKVYALRAGLEALAALDYEALAYLDADLDFAPDYFEFLLGKLAADPQLGLIGTPYVELDSEVYNFDFVSLEQVSGACQLFRRQCHDQIGGYKAIRGGAIDTVACIEARMCGWKTRTFTEMHTTHHRKMGTAQASQLRARFRTGGKDYAIGNHPIWELSRVLYQMTLPPRILRGAAIYAGYLLACIKRKERILSPQARAFYRKEQLQRLKNKMLSVLRISPGRGGAC